MACFVCCTSSCSSVRWPPPRSPNVGRPSPNSTGTRWIEDLVDEALADRLLRGGGAHHGDVLVPGRLPCTRERRHQVADERVDAALRDVVGRRVRQHEERQPRARRRAVGSPVRDRHVVRRPSADHGAEPLDLAIEERSPGLVVERPVVQALAVVTEPGLQTHVRTGHEAVQRHARVEDHDAHLGLLPITVAPCPTVTRPRRRPRARCARAPRRPPSVDRRGCCSADPSKAAG